MEASNESRSIWAQASNSVAASSAWTCCQRAGTQRGCFRFTLSRGAVADMLGTDVEAVSVGMYWFDPEEYSSRTFSARDVRDAVREGRDLAARLAELAR